MNALIQHTKVFYTSLMEGDFVWYLRSIRIAVPSPQMADEVLPQDVCYDIPIWIFAAYWQDIKRIFCRGQSRRDIYAGHSSRNAAQDEYVPAYDIRESAFCFAISGNRQIRCRSPPSAIMAVKNL